MCGRNLTAENLILAQGTRLEGSGHPCGDGVNDAQTSVLQGEAQTAAAVRSSSNAIQS